MRDSNLVYEHVNINSMILLGVRMSIKICPKCNVEFEDYSKYGPKKFCSRTCANSRGIRTDEFKAMVRSKMLGREMNEAAILKGILSKGLTAQFVKPFPKCEICNKDKPNRNKTCSKQCYTILLTRNSQRHPKCGGQKHTHRSLIYNTDGEKFIAESSFEVKLANSLNENNIRWIRPEHFIYKDLNNNERRYYPDFYLPDHDIYLDPKNNHLIRTDIDKINRTAFQNEIKIIILGEKYLDYQFFKHLVEDDGYAPPSPACRTGVFLLN